jgi:hypothetical protein
MPITLIDSYEDGDDVAEEDDMENEEDEQNGDDFELEISEDYGLISYDENFVK